MDQNQGGQPVPESAVAAAVAGVPDLLEALQSGSTLTSEQAAAVRQIASAASDALSPERAHEHVGHTGDAAPAGDDPSAEEEHQ